MNWKATALIGVIVLGGLLNWEVSKNQKLTNENERLNSQLSEQIAITTDYENRINSLHELDTKHTTELTNAKAELNKLRDDIRNGTKRVYINAKCPKLEANTTESRSNEGSARLSEAAEQDYWYLREMMAENEKQTLYLQNYIRMECLR
ncbi:lysis protein [Providencia alcalifaciens]|uniref:Phage Rz-family lysis protein n=1 Tax=Providencia alcalifaciens 205/92 TaxID=1256988 RepID=A0AAV3M440_9GAMM|nr:lysis protein [Providencia alcalifaciens]EUD10447.1 phage Rz-family lysis protein [Providencia alcalifaciens 205/92]MTC16283.1 lysis protein [Providencia alcalifaciens]MTC29150.1 lysis protein [Providencia alcalifaciens]MTC61952.1 lysis protein [Providencia alcalifaciens]WGZ54980.1 lysis protein [Providencia alcalifaciens]